MNPYSNPKRITRWMLTCVVSVLTAASAFGQLVRTSPGPITINDEAKATPYPSTVAVTGVLPPIATVQTNGGGIQRVTVTLTGVSHGYPDDIDIILESPTGTKVMLMSDAGGQFSLSGTDITLDQNSGTPLPDEALITSGSY